MSTNSHELQRTGGAIELIIENNVAWIYLNRPEVFNSFNREMALSLQDALDVCSTDSNVRSLVITGRGKAFCAGQDLKEVTDPELNPGFRAITNNRKTNSSCS
jgi:2-(1,2-epoxy-1,2-dihydrophenyl)acetyl-CoA isomerase